MKLVYPFTFGTPGDFSTIQRPEFDAAKAAGTFAANMGKLPILVLDDGTSIGQSKAIERYVAAKVGLMGSSPVEAAQIDCLTEHERDIKQTYMTAKNAPDKAAALEKYFGEQLPEALTKVEKSLPPATSGDFLLGAKLSLADVVFFAFFTEFFDDKAATAKALDAATCPRLKKAIAATASHPKIAAWVEKRPKTPF